MEFRAGPAILDYVNGAELERYAGAGVVTPDHTIRTKNYPLIVPPPEAGTARRVRARGARARRRDSSADYEAYFARHNAGAGAAQDACSTRCRA